MEAAKRQTAGEVELTDVQLRCYQEFRTIHSLLSFGGFYPPKHDVSEFERAKRIKSLREWLAEVATTFGRMVDADEAFTTGF